MLSILICALFCLNLRLASTTAPHNSENINAQGLATLRSYMDFEENPCEDFYQYACGNWEFVHYNEHKYLDVIGSLEYNANHEMSEILEQHIAARDAESAIDDVYRKVITYYASCRQKEPSSKEPPALATYLEILKPGQQVDWPTTDVAKWNAEHFNWLEALGRLRAIGLNGVLFSEQLKRSNATQYIIELSSPDNIELDQEDLLELERSVGKQTKLVELVFHFKQKVKQLKSAFGAHRMLSELTYGDLERRLPGMNLSAYFVQLLGEAPTKETPILVQNLVYLRKLQQLMNKTPPEVVVVYLKLKLLGYLRAHTPRRTDAQNCVKSLRKHASLGLAYIYERERYRRVRNESDAVIRRVFQSLKLKFVELIDSHDAELNSVERDFLKLKINKMQLNIGNLPQRVSDAYFSEYFAEFYVEPEYFHWNQLNLMQHAVLRRHYLLKIGSKPQSPEHSFIPWKYGSPMYDQLSNRILIPFAYLHMPVFHRDFMDLWLYAELGNTLGHEIMHGFDTTGLQYDAYGNPNELFLNAMELKPHFKRTLQCLRREQTTNINEKLADFSGFRLAYESYFHRTGFPKNLENVPRSNKKLFFIKFAQFFCAVSPYRVSYGSTHDTPFKRVPQIVANHPEFEQVFNCDANVKLKKPEHCDMW